MFLLLKLAFRNLTRNRVRTLLNLIMVLGAFVSIILFKGFANSQLRMIENAVTRGPEGHIQIAKISAWNGDTPRHAEDSYIENYQELETRLKALPQVEETSGRAQAYVLLSNGDHSVGALAVGIDPKVYPEVRKTMLVTEGKEFSEGGVFEILVGGGLQSQLLLKPGQTLTVVSQSLAGSISSIEPEVRGIVKTGIAEIDNSVVYLPLPAMQKLLSTDRVEKLALVLKKDSKLSSGLKAVKEALQDRPELVVKGWRETAVLFQQIVDFYGSQNILIAVVLSVLVFFGILNTISMSILERLGEIGTLRALGDQKSEVITLLLLEGLLLGLTGAVFGVPVSAFFSAGLTALKFPILMPGASLPDPVKIEPETWDYVYSAVVVVTTCLIASLWPTLKAVRLSIVDALRANS
jgi:putative ABC transport system permease protein